MLGVINRRTENAMVEGKKTKQKQSKQTYKEKKKTKNMFSEQQETPLKMGWAQMVLECWAVPAPLVTDVVVSNNVGHRMRMSVLNIVGGA